MEMGFVVEVSSVDSLAPAVAPAGAPALDVRVIDGAAASGEAASILLVEDDGDVREALAEMLELMGYEVAVAVDGLDALAYLRAHAAPRVILLDWRMPRCDGAEFRRRQLDEPALADIPVVLVTAEATPREKMAALGLDECVPKPIDLDRLAAVLARYGV